MRERKKTMGEEQIRIFVTTKRVGSAAVKQKKSVRKRRKDLKWPGN